MVYTTQTTIKYNIYIYNYHDKGMHHSNYYKICTTCHQINEERWERQSYTVFTGEKASVELVSTFTDNVDSWAFVHSLKAFYCLIMQTATT
jgi:hypothetical protein